MATQMQDFTSDTASKFLDQSKELYAQAKEWLPENSNMVIGIAAAGLTLGAVGFMLGKSRAPSPEKRESQSKAEGMKRRASDKVNGFDFSPVYKILKLWMLYRIAV
jgi:hypothetical protein